MPIPVTEYRAMRATMTPRSIAAELRRREKHPPGPAFDLEWDRDYRGGGVAYLVTGEGIPADLTVRLIVEHDDCADSIDDEIMGAGFRLTNAGRHDPTDDEEQERPHHCAVIAEVGGRNGYRYVWIWYPDTEIKAPPGMARGPAEVYRRTEARRYAAAMAAAAEDRANGGRAIYYVSAAIEHDGEEVWSDSLSGIDAEDEEEAARYYWEERGRAEAADTIRDWRRILAADLARRAASLAERAAALLTP